MLLLVHKLAVWTKYLIFISVCMLTAGLEGEPTEEELKEVETQKLVGTPLGRLGKLSEVADLVVYLCSNEASYVSGTTVSIDGGKLR